MTSNTQFLQNVTPESTASQISGAGEAVSTPPHAKGPAIGRTLPEHGEDEQRGSSGHTIINLTLPPEMAEDSTKH
jgi:hypothetical protein